MGRTKGTWICKFCRRANPLTEQSQDECLKCYKKRCRKCGKQGLGVIRNSNGNEVLTEKNLFGNDVAHSLTCPSDNNQKTQSEKYKIKGLADNHPAQKEYNKFMKDKAD